MVIILLQSILSAFACAAFSVVFNAPRRELFWCGLNGGLGWLVYSLLMAKSNHAVSATLAAAAAVTLAARLLSYHRQAGSLHVVPYPRHSAACTRYGSLSRYAGGNPGLHIGNLFQRPACIEARRGHRRRVYPDSGTAVFVF